MSETSHLLSKQNSQQPKQFRGGEKKVMKKSLSLLVAIAMVFSMFATLVSAAEKQTDGEYLSSIGVIKGNASGDLLGDEDWKRQDVAVIISRLLGQEAAAKATAKGHEYTDVRGTFYDGYLTWASEKGLMEGNPNGTFGFDAPITYKEFAAVVLRALGVDTTGENFANVEELAVEAGLLPEGTDFKANAVRDVTYTVIVKALDTKIDGVKLGTKLGLPGYEITELEIAKASAIVANSVVVTFNADLEKLANEDVQVLDKDNNEILVEKVSIDGAVATIALAGTLSKGDYTVVISNATSKEGYVLDSSSATFSYAKADPASVAFKATTVAVDDNLTLVVKDAAGNDISADYDNSDFDVVTSNSGVVNDNLEAKAIGLAVVNATFIDDEEVTTGNVSIQVKDVLTLETNAIKISNLDGTSASASALRVGETYELLTTIADQNGTEYNDDSANVDVTYTSKNPTIATVDSQAKTIRANQAGTATIVSTFKKDGVTTTKTLVVTVKEQPVATSFTVDNSSITVVNGAGLPATLKVTILDQYGDKYGKEDKFVTVKNNATNVATVDASTSDVVKLAGDNGVAEFVVAAGSNGTATLTISVDDIKGSKKVTVRTVAKANAVGYVVETNNGTTIDINPHTDATKKLGSLSTTVLVYVKDANGNKIDVATGVDVRPTVAASKSILTIGTDNTISATSIGKEAVDVYVGDVRYATLTIDAVASSKFLVTKVSQAKTSIKVKIGDISSALFGKNGAFQAENRYEEQVVLNDSTTVGNDIEVMSSNSSVVGNSSNSTVTASSEGTVTLTVKINGKFYTVNVNVTN